MRETNMRHGAAESGTRTVSGRVVVTGPGGQVGVPGVAVSDGLVVTQTDASGLYRLTVDPQRRHTSLVFITVPSGWRAPVGRSAIPRFYRSVDLADGDIVGVDFVLHPDSESADHRHRFMALADVHVQDGSINPPAAYGRQLEQLNRYADELGSDRPRFVVIAGDLTNDATDAEFAGFRAAARGSALPIWPAPGNHDLTGRIPGGAHPKPGSRLPYRDAIDAYRRALGPEWYSFQYGGRHYVVLENYRGLAEPDQLAWLRQDLEINAVGREVVVITHVPWNVPQTAPGARTSPYLAPLGDYDVRLLLAGHTHSNDVTPGLVGHAIQAVTTSAAYSLDQTPRGFRLVEFGAHGVALPFAEFDAHRRATLVAPVGPVDDSPATVHVTRYHPPGVPAEVEYRLPPHDWQAMRQFGRHTWTAPLDGVAVLSSEAAHRIQIRGRDRPAGDWAQNQATFRVATGSPMRPRQGTPWPMFHRDPAHTGSTADVVRPPLRLAWTYLTGHTILGSSPALVHGTVFIGVRDEDGTSGNGVCALDLVSGTLRWRTATSSPVESSVAVDGDVLLVAPARGPLLGLDVATGQERWRWAPADERCWMYFSPAVADGVAYQAVVDPRGAWVVALEVTTGKPLWHTHDPVGRNWISQGSPTVTGEHVLFATAYANLVCLDRWSGDVRWQRAFGGWTRSMPVLSAGLALLACQGDRLVAVDVNGGQPQWCHEPPEPMPDAPTTATPAVVGDVIYAAFADGSVAAFDLATGAPRWRRGIGGPVTSSPAVSGDVLYVGCDAGMFRALDRSTGEVVWSYDIGCRIASSPAVTGNAVVVAAWDGNVYAFVSADGQPTP